MLIQMAPRNSRKGAGDTDRADLDGQSSLGDGLDTVLDRLQLDVDELRQAIVRLHQHTDHDWYEAERAAAHPALRGSEGAVDHLYDRSRHCYPSRRLRDVVPADVDERLARLRRHIDQARTELAHARHQDERHFWD